MKTLVPLLAAASLWLAACEKTGNCLDEQLHCENGILQQGQCHCNEGYEGIACEREKIPVSTEITNITLDGYPWGACTNYDADDEAPYMDADLYLALYQNGLLLYHNRALAITNYDGSAIIYNTPNWRLSRPNDGYELRLYDRNEGSLAEDELISTFHFFPYERGKGFLAPLRLEGYFECEIGFFSYGRPYSLKIHQQYIF